MIFTQARHRYNGAVPDGVANTALPNVTLPLAESVVNEPAPPDKAIVPLVDGKVITVEPATFGGSNVTDPDVKPPKTNPPAIMLPLV
jgi:hypothetical protein